MYPTYESVITMTNNTVTQRDFATGLLAGLAHENARQIPTHQNTKKLEWALIGAYRLLSSRGAVLEFEIDKSIDVLIAAAQNGLASIGADGVLHVQIDRDYTDIYFENLPLSEALWREAAKALLDRLELTAEL